jgi:virginiamycin B lyase
MVSFMRRRGRATSILAFLIVLATATPADARPRFAGAFDLSGTPGQIARGPDGNIWVTLSNSGLNNTLAQVRPNGDVTEFAPAAVVNPVGITSGPDGNLWLTRNGGVIRVPPADPDSAQDFAINKITDPRAIRSGPGGLLWTASADQLVSIPPADPAGGFDATTINGMGARGIAASGGRLWIADFGGQRIVGTTPGGNPDFFDVGGGPQEVAGGPSKQVAYSNPQDVPQTVGRIRLGGTPKETNVPLSDPFGIAFAPDGHWWFAEFAKHAVGLLSVGGDVEQFKGLPDNSGPRYLTVGPNGTIWVSLETAGKVAKIKGVAPQTRITRRPDSPVETGSQRATVKFRFRSSAPGSSFKCALKRGGGAANFHRCSSPKKYRVGPGRYTFLVRAKSMGVTDPSPAKDRFKVVQG